MSNAPRIDQLETNYCINGSMDFWQRRTTITLSGVGTIAAYTADQWTSYIQGSTSKTVIAQRSTDVPSVTGALPFYSLKGTNSAALSTPASDDVVNVFNHRLEGYLVRDFLGKSLYLSFWFKSSVAGTYPVSARGASMSYVTTFAYSTINTWQLVKVQIPIPITFVPYSVNFETGIGIMLDIAAISGTTGKTSNTDQWVSGAYTTTTSSTNWASTINQNISITLVHISNQANSDSFTRAGQTYPGELALCQRYYEKSFDVNTVPVQGAGLTNALAFGNIAPNISQQTPSTIFKVQKRIIPTVVTYNPTSANAQIRSVSGTAGDWSSTSAIATVWSVSFVGIANATLAGAQCAVHWTADASM